MGCCFAGPAAAVSGPAHQKKPKPSTRMKKPLLSGDRHSFVIPNNSGLSPLETYEIARSDLGSGAFGTVRQAKNKKTGQMVALKTMKRSAIPNIKAFQNEVDINLGLDHPHVVKLFETFEDRQNVYLVLEMCVGGDLFDAIIAANHFSERDASRLMNQLLHAVFYMHSVNIAHRDLKPENFLLKEKGVPLASNTLKIIDFGIAKKFRRGKDDLRTRSGTAYYVAPEVHTGMYTEKCDIWSCGVIMYILLSGAPPFGGDDDNEVYRASCRGHLDFSLSEFRGVTTEAKKLMKCMCALKVQERFSAEQCVRHPWIEHPAMAGANTSEPLPMSLFKKLRSFSSVDRFKKAALQVIAHRLDDKCVKRLKGQFQSLDTNGDGQLTVSEMQQGVANCDLPIDAKEMAKLFQQIDVDGNGAISWTEFLAAMIDHKNLLKEEACWEAFRVFDRDQNGLLSLDEVREVLAEDASDGKALLQIEDDVEELFKKADSDGDGAIDFEEFKAMLQRS